MSDSAAVSTDGKNADTTALTVLGATVREPLDHVECFPKPEGCSRVRFSTEEVSSFCPVTGQPDLSAVVIEYVPDELCVESKSLKLFLWSFRDRSVFAEALAAEIADEVASSAEPTWIRVTVTQRPRGGIELQTVSEHGDPSSVGSAAMGAAEGTVDYSP